LTRLRWTYPVHFNVLTACGLLLALTAASGAPPPGSAAHRNRIRLITVNSKVGALSAGAALTTLPEALIQAANDPEDNLIQFDPAVFGPDPVIIKPADPIGVDNACGGHDRIDGGSARGGVILDTAGCPDAGVVVGESTRLTLAHLTIRGGMQRVVLVKDSGRLVLEHVTVEGGAGPGVALFGESTATLRRCRLINNRTHGLELHGRASARLENVELCGNGQSGLAAFDHTATTICDSELESNGDWNVVLTQDARASLTRCALRRGRFANADVGGSARLELTACTIEQGPRFGLFATGCSSIELIDTRLGKHGGRGIELQDQAALNLQASRIEANGDYGLILFGESSVQATQAVITRNAAHGASLRGQASGQFEECVFAGNRYSGIGCLDAHDGGRVRAARCIFTQNGMRPIYRGPMHLDPMVPTPMRIEGQSVVCIAEPHATIELFLDRAGEAAHYLKTIPADHRGQFRVDCRDVPEGWAMTATATSGGATSECNVIAGTNAAPVLNALLARTGPLSDSGGELEPDRLLRRWKPGTHLIFQVVNPPTAAVERYVRFLVDRISDWTQGSVSAELRIGQLPKVPTTSVVIPIRYVETDSPQLLGRGGVTFMKWDAAGFFMTPMEVLLALGKDVRETCPRVLAHEIGHALGLCHARVGLLSRMQGTTPPSGAFVNDFSPMMTYYDVLALQVLHDARNSGNLTLRALLERGALPRGRRTKLTRAKSGNAEPTFSPAAPRPPAGPE